VKYDIPRCATIRRLAKLLVACPSAIREIGPTNRSLRSTQGDTARSCKWPERPTRVVGAVAANDGNPPRLCENTRYGTFSVEWIAVIQMGLAWPSGGVLPSDLLTSQQGGPRCARQCVLSSAIFHDGILQFRDAGIPEDCGCGVQPPILPGERRDT